jgi:hypothetical protein
MWRFSLAALLVLTGCKFDPSGVGGDDDVSAIDANPNAIDADPNAIDAPPPDAVPPDAQPDLDADDDGVLDATDNCVQIPNADQHDEDADTVGDVCDNCPHVDNTDQANTTEPGGVTGDQVGDACDPHPTTADVIALFDPFTGNGAPTGWTTIGGSWSKAGDEVSQTTAAGANYLYRTGFSSTNVVLQATIDVDSVTPGTGGGGNAFRSVGELVFFTAGGASGHGYLCLVLDDANDPGQAVMFSAEHADNGGTSSSQFSAQLGATLQAGQTYVVRTSADGTNWSCQLVRGTPVTLSDADASFTSGTVALRTNNVTASFRYAVVITPAP